MPDPGLVETVCQYLDTGAVSVTWHEQTLAASDKLPVPRRRSPDADEVVETFAGMGNARMRVRAMSERLKSLGVTLD